MKPKMDAIVCYFVSVCCWIDKLKMNNIATTALLPLMEVGENDRDAEKKTTLFTAC